MTIAVTLLTCGRVDYTRRTLESFSAQHPDARDRVPAPARGRRLDRARDPRAGRGARVRDRRAEPGPARRAGAPGRRGRRGRRAGRRLGRSCSRTTGNGRGRSRGRCSATWSRRGRTSTTCASTGRYKDRARALRCWTMDMSRDRRAVTWTRLEGAPEPAEVGFIHWGAPPAVTRIAEATRLCVPATRHGLRRQRRHARNAGERPTRPESGARRRQCRRITSATSQAIARRLVPKAPARDRAAGLCVPGEAEGARRGALRPHATGPAEAAALHAGVAADAHLDEHGLDAVPGDCARHARPPGVPARRRLRRRPPGDARAPGRRRQPGRRPVGRGRGARGPARPARPRAHLRLGVLLGSRRASAGRGGRHPLRQPGAPPRAWRDAALHGGASRPAWRRAHQRAAAGLLARQARRARADLRRRDDASARGVLAARGAEDALVWREPAGLHGARPAGPGDAAGAADRDHDAHGEPRAEAELRRRHGAAPGRAGHRPGQPSTSA